MPKQHVVQAGECITSIAEKYGFFWDTIWNDPANEALRNLRHDPNTLVPGDVVTILDKRPKHVAVETDKTHTFRKKGIPALCRLQLYDGDAFRAHQEYTLDIDGVRHTGVTGDKGILEVFIEGEARKGRLVIGPDEAVYELYFGQLQPVSTVSGQKARLSNLGFDAGDPATGPDETMRDALLDFQGRFGLRQTGKADEPTQAKLHKLHDEISELPEEEPAPEEEDDLVPNEEEDFDY